MRRLVSAVLALATLAPPLAAQAPTPLRIDALMSERDRQETGVARLTAAERQAFERWLSRYTAAAVAGATRVTEESGTTARRTAERAPERGRRSPRHAQRVVLGATVEITSVLANGGFLVMEDGSMWEVYVRDITGSSTWTAGDQVLVRDNPAPPDLLYRLRFENGRARSTASVRYAGRTGPAVKTSSDSTRTGELSQESIFRTGGAASGGAVLAFVAPVSPDLEPARQSLDPRPGVAARRALGTLDVGSVTPIGGERQRLLADLPAGSVGVRARAVTTPIRNAAARRR